MKTLLFAALVLSGCAYFQDMPTGKGSYMWCYEQTQPIPACRNYNMDKDEEDEEDEED